MTQTFEPAGIEELLRKGRRSGQVTAEDVLAAIPEAETNRERLSSIVAQLSQDGITVRIDSDSGRGATAAVEEARRIVDEAVGIDDPVRMYLREIGKVPLLTAADEKRLARAMEEWLHIAAIQTRLREEFDREPTYGAVLSELLREFHKMRPVYASVSRHLKMPRQALSLRIIDPTFRATIDYELDEGAHEHLQKDLGWEEDVAHQALKDLSTVTHIMRPEHVRWGADFASSEAKVFPPKPGLAEHFQANHAARSRTTSRRSSTTASAPSGS